MSKSFRKNNTQRVSLCLSRMLGVLLTGIFLVGPAPANFGQPYFRNYSTDDGLPSPEVHDILQDRQGYIWIATDSGVSRFDGYQFKNFGAEEGLKNSVVFHLQEDHYGRIWMQTMAGNLYYFYQGTVQSYPFNHLFSYYRNYFSIPNDFHMEADGTLYTSLYGIGILKISPTGESELINLCHYHDITLRESPEFDRYLYSVVWRSSLLYLNWEEARTGVRPAMGIYGDTLRQSYILPRNQGYTSLYAYVDDDVMVFDIRKELNVYVDDELKLSTQLPTSIAEVTRIGEAFWMGFNDRHGVRLYQDQEALLADDFQSYLVGESISAICRDRAGGYWFGTLNEGIYYTPNLDLQVIHPGEPGSNSNVLSMEAWKEDQLLFGTDNGMLYSLDSADRVQELFQVPGPVFDLWYRPASDDIWVAAIPLQIMDANGLERVRYAPELGVPNWVVVKKLHPLHGQPAVIGSSGHGVDFIDLNREVVTYSTIHSSIKERYLEVFEDAQGRIWVGNTRGLFQFLDSTLISPPIEHAAFQLRVEDIDQLADSTLVVGSKGGGLILWKDDSIRIFDKSRGLTTNMIETITIDSMEQIWIGTLNGLNKLFRPTPQDDWQVKSFSMAHGLPSNEINDLFAHGNWMYVATSKGITKLPLVDTSRAIIPHLILERIAVNGTPREAGDLQTLKFSERNLQLTYLCINYKFDGRIQYRYRLSSAEDWTYTYERSVNYAALAPGFYQFEVQAQDEDGDWSDPLSLSFAISSPVWQRPWFFLLILLLAIAMVYYRYRRRLARLKKEASIEKEINELQRSALQAQMNPHFIFNCLNSIQNFIASGNKTSAMEYLSRFAKLVRITLKASVETVISLQEEVDVLENYLELEKLRFGNRFDYEIFVDPRLDVFDTTLPPLLVQPFVENAIIHGFNFTDPAQKGKIYLGYELIGALLQVTIRDNGIGIEASRRRRIGKEKLRTSLGMQITRKRLSIQNHSEEKEQLKITEMVDSEGNVAGTEVKIRIKF